MPAPTNISAATATAIGAGQTITQRVDDSGTTYTVWYKFAATFDGVVGVWAFGDLTTYKPGYDVYYNNGTTQFMNYNALPNNDSTFPNRPFLIPITSGITYYLQISPNSGNPSPANLTISVVQFSGTGAKRGDFISNRETDDDYEHPMTVASGSVDYTVNQFVQVAAPLPTAVIAAGLPHGHYGAILDSGYVMYEDDAFGTVKIFNAQLQVSATITKYEGYQLIVVGSNKKAGKFYVAYIQTIPGTVHLDELNAQGQQTNTWTLTGVTTVQAINVNNDATFAYFTQTASNSLFKKINLSTLAITTLDTVTSSNVEDCLYLEDDTIVVVYYTNGSAPTTVTAKRYDTTGAVLDTYTFGGALYRTSLNPPRIGFALDSPSSFWITLKPQSDFGLSIYKNIKISDGSVLTTRNQANYLFGQYIGAATATPPARFGPEKSGALLVMPVGAPPQVFIGSPASLSIRRERTVPIPVLPGNARQKIVRLELQFQPGTGLPADPTTSPQFFVRISWDNGKTWSNERLMQAGREGAYVTRAFVNLLGSGRFPVVQIVTSDTFLPVLTNAFFTGAEGVH